MTPRWLKRAVYRMGYRPAPGHPLHSQVLHWLYASRERARRGE